MRWLNKMQVARYHKELITLTGGMDGVRDENLLESALASPLSTFSGVDLYPSVAAKIARVAYGLACNHPFVDGNKRTATRVLIILLDLNHIDVSFTDAELVDIGLKLANGEMNAEQLEVLIDNKFFNI